MTQQTRLKPRYQESQKRAETAKTNQSFQENEISPIVAKTLLHEKSRQQTSALSDGKKSTEGDISKGKLVKELKPDTENYNALNMFLATLRQANAEPLVPFLSRNWTPSNLSNKLDRSPKAYRNPKMTLHIERIG
jgi:hypothetical protein